MGLLRQEVGAGEHESKNRAVLVWTLTMTDFAFHLDIKTIWELCLPFKPIKELNFFRFSSEKVRGLILDTDLY